MALLLRPHPTMVARSPQFKVLVCTEFHAMSFVAITSPMLSCANDSPRITCSNPTSDVEHERDTQSQYFSDEFINIVPISERLKNQREARNASYVNMQLPPRLGDAFFSVPCIKLAQRLLGQVLVRTTDDGIRLSGLIVETECYPGGEDLASHSFKGKRTNRNAAMFMKPGTAYVYTIYGMYHCFNISSEGEGAAVLIRAIEPREGTTMMKQLRGTRRRDKGLQLKNMQVCNGPSKLCQALNINKDIDQWDLSVCPFLWIEHGMHVNEEDIVSAPRIGIRCEDEEWLLKPLRFYIQGNQHVSVRIKSIVSTGRSISIAKEKQDSDIKPKLD